MVDNCLECRHFKITHYGEKYSWGKCIRLLTHLEPILNNDSAHVIEMQTPSNFGCILYESKRLKTKPALIPVAWSLEL